MPTRHSVTVSPSRVRISRSTPCVDGCCGPMLMTMCQVPGVSAAWSAAATSSSQSWPETLYTRPSAVASCFRPPLIRRRHLGPAVLDGDTAERVVLALRVTLPVVRHLDPGQRWVPVEDDAEEVPGLPLVPVERRV